MYEESNVDSALVTSLLKVRRPLSCSFNLTKDKDFVGQLPEPLFTFALFDQVVAWSKTPQVHDFPFFF